MAKKQCVGCKGVFEDSEEVFNWNLNTGERRCIKCAEQKYQVEQGREFKEKVDKAFSSITVSL